MEVPVKQQLWLTAMTCLAYCINKELYHLILSSVDQLEYVLEEFCQYYRHERIHQSLGRIIEPKHEIGDNAEIQCIQRLGGLLKSYHRLAA